VKNNRALLILISAVALTIALAGYIGMRASQITRLRQQVSVLEAREARRNADEAGVAVLRIKFPEKADVSSFVEGLYTLAQASGLENVEITTVDEHKARSSKKRGAQQDSATLLVPYRVKISCEGKYRILAQYLGRVHDVRRYNKVVSFDLKPGENTIKASIIVEIMSFEVRNAT
jgi:Tfp pilus assembly protein PilO